MSEFWWGVLALPLILVGVALAVGVVLGGWLALEKWAEHRTAEHNRDDGDSLASTIVYRREFACWVLAAPKVRRFKLGYGCALFYVRGLNRIPKPQYDTVRDALYATTDKLDDRTTA